MTCCDTSIDSVVEPFRFTIVYVDPDIAGNRVGENNAQLRSLHRPGDDESMLVIVTSIVITTILSILNAAIAGLPDLSQTVCELWGCQEEPNGDDGPHARNDTAIVYNKTDAGWVRSWWN